MIAMLYAYLAGVLGVATIFVADPLKLPMILACLACGALYLRSMSRKAGRR